MMVVETKYKLGDLVYLITDKDQLPRMITGMLIKPTGIQYELSCGGFSSWSYEIEITTEKNVLASLTY